MNTIESKNVPLKIIQTLILLIASISISNAQWIPQGPGPSHKGQIENVTDRPVSGAINCVTPHPSNADILYIGAVNGGVWRTINATDLVPTWTFISDDLTSPSIGALEFDPLDAASQTLVVANAFTSSISSRGSGTRSIFKTTNGIAPWTNIDPNNAFVNISFTGVAPRGNTIVVSTGAGGISRTTNNGGLWNTISGSGTGLPVGTSFDLVSDPSDNTILYTNAGSNGIYKSTDTGANWNKVSDAAVDGQLAGLSSLKMAVGNNDNVFVGIIRAGRLNAIFRSGDGGTTWTQLDLPTTTETSGVFGINPGGQGNTHFSITADPSDDNLVYVGGDIQPILTSAFSGTVSSLGATDWSGRLFRVDASLAAGSQANAITHSGTASSSSPHGDSRDMDFNADGILLEGDDGGVFSQSSPSDNTGDWNSLNGNLEISEAHSGEWDALSNIPILGLQDNGVTEQDISGVNPWEVVARGDGGDVAVGNIAGAISTRYSSNQRLLSFRMRQYNSASQFQAGTQSFPTLLNTANGISIMTSDGTLPFVTPIASHSQNATRLLVATNVALYESADQGTTVTSILNPSINTTSGRDVLVYGAADNAELIYAGRGSTVRVRTTLGGALNAAAGYAGGTVDGICIDPDNSTTLFVIDQNSVFRSTNSGTNFTDRTGNLLALNPGQFLSVEYITQSTTDLLVVGTSLGVYVASAPNFNVWSELDANLPTVRVEELTFSGTDNILLAATLGRGAWTYSFNERDPVDISLVLDFSGSMASVACPTCDPKIDVLKNAVEIFLQIWKTLAVGDDKVTTVYFRTDVDKFDIGGVENLDVIDDTDAIITDVNSQTTTPTALTAMGGGLQTGIDELSDATVPRHVLLFTDGMQNVDPGIRYPELDILDGQYGTNSNVSEAAPPMDLSAIGDVRVHTIGIGATPAFETQLDDISTETTGLTKITTAPDEDLIQFYIEDLVEILRDFSPQLITYRKNIHNNQSIESVDINNSASQVLFKLSYPEQSGLSVRIYKDGKDVTRLAEIINGDFYQIFHYPFDKILQLQTGNPSSEWQVVISKGNPNNKYQLAVIADEHLLDYNVGILNGPLFVGEGIKLFTNIKIKGKPFKGDAKVFANIYCPTISVANLMSKFKMPEDGRLKLEKGSLIGERKYNLLMQERKFTDQLKRKTVKVALEKAKDGYYTGILPDTKIAGNYLIEYFIEGKAEEIGTFTRTETRSAIVQFGKFDPDKSALKLNKDDNGTYILTVNPTDVFGNLLGPDQLSNFRIETRNGGLKTKKDNGDGSYRFEFSFESRDAAISIKHKKQTILSRDIN